MRVLAKNKKKISEKKSRNFHSFFFFNCFVINDLCKLEIEFFKYIKKNLKIFVLEN